MRPNQVAKRPSTEDACLLKHPERPMARPDLSRRSTRQSRRLRPKDSLMSITQVMALTFSIL